MIRSITIFALASFIPFGVACSSSNDGAGASPDHAAEVVANMHQTLLTDIQELHAAAQDLTDAAPAAAGRGWSDTDDADAIDAMTRAWIRARGAYERTEGAIAPLFPDIDVEIDERYDGFLEALGTTGDQNLFDDEGVTGMHAIERILYAKTMPPSVIAVEATLPGYVAAAWPATEQEAADFKTKLCARLVKDTQTLVDQWRPQAIDLAQAYDGLVALMNEQREKVNKAASEEEESRYSRRTMADIRDNLIGTKTAYSLFQSWLRSKRDGAVIDGDVEDSFSKLDAVYATVPGDAFPPLPATWSSETPSEADLQTSFGKLFTAVHQAVDPNVKGSTVDGMNRAATALGFAEFTE